MKKSSLAMVLTGLLGACAWASTVSAVGPVAGDGAAANQTGATPPTDFAAVQQQ